MPAPVQTCPRRQIVLLLKCTEEILHSRGLALSQALELRRIFQLRLQLTRTITLFEYKPRSPAHSAPLLPAPPRLERISSDHRFLALVACAMWIGMATVFFAAVAAA